MSAKKRILFILLIISLILCVCVFSSCASDLNVNAGSKSNDATETDPDAILSDILKSYKKNGLSLWWEVVAIYNAGENPADYKGFEDLYKSLEGETIIKMASYIIVADIGIITGTDSGKFEKYEEYKSNLKDFLENPSDERTLNNYIFAYYALKCSDMSFNEEIPVLNYFAGVQKSDGGFALTGDSGDIDMTAFMIPALNLLLYKSDDPLMDFFDMDMSCIKNAVKFLEDNIGDDGTFGSFGSENANSTACALSALIDWYFGNPAVYEEDAVSNEIIQKAADGLALFKVKDKKEPGYSYLKDGRADSLATAQAAIALGDLKNKTSVWDKLYLESVEKFN